MRRRSSSILRLSYYWSANRWLQPDHLITTVSTKGQVILPKDICLERNLDAGTRLIVEETPEGVLLKRAPVSSSMEPSAVFGMLPLSGEAEIAGRHGGRRAGRSASSSMIAIDTNLVVRYVTGDHPDRSVEAR